MQKTASASSSRSESPVSDRNTSADQGCSTAAVAAYGVRNSAMMPHTDSDCPISELAESASGLMKSSSGGRKSPKRKEKRGYSKKLSSRRGSPILRAAAELEGDQLETCPRKSTSRRRLRSQHKVEYKTSSSSESLSSYR